MNKLAGDHIQVIVGGYNLTGDHNQITLDDARETYDVTSFGDAVRNYIPGRRVISMGHMGYMNLGAARSHTALRGITVSGVVSVLLGDNLDPMDGDIAYSMAIRQGRYHTLSRAGDYIPFTAVFANRGELGGWGRVLRVPGTFTNTFNGTTVDEGAATTEGGAVYLHIVQAGVTDTYTFRVEGSATGAFGGEETTLATFVQQATSIGSERVAITGTLPRYVRLRAIRSGSAGDPVNVSATIVRF